MKKITALFIVFALTIGFSVPVCFARETPAPVIVNTVYPTQDAVVADIIATEAPYYVDSTGQTDCTAGLQRALDDCARSGGGTVFLPAGRYLITGHLYIRPFVTLRGDWQDPDEGTDYGTVIVARPESTEEKTPALFDVGGSAGAVGLTVWYPDQSIDDVKPYPYTFYVNGKRDYMLHTLKNITLLNSYRGIGLCSLCEEGVYQCHEMTTLENVKGTCLKEGLNSYNSADVDVYKTVSIENRYWTEAGEAYNAPPAEALKAYTRQNATGFVLGDLEWPEISDVRISDCAYGIHLKKGIRVQFNGSFYRLDIRRCDYAFYAEEDSVWSRGANWGVSVAESVLEGCKSAVCYQGDAVFELHNVKLLGKMLVRNPQITSSAPICVPMDKTYQKPAPVLYTVEADRTGMTDASPMVREALAAAEQTGGVVYLPGGIYRFNGPVTVPAGVELRGASSVGTRDQSGETNGTLILSFYGYGEEDAPLVTLAGDGAGVNGLRFDYPLSAPEKEKEVRLASSPCIAIKAEGNYVVNSFVNLASVGVRCENGKNVFIKRLVGTSYLSMIRMENCENVWIEACLQNGNTVTRNGYHSLDVPELQGRLRETDIFDVLFEPVLKQTSTYLDFENCADVTVFQTFIYGTKHYMRERDSSVLLVNIGCDGNNGSQPMLQLDGGSVKLLNSMRMEGRMYQIENRTDYRSYNSMLITGRCKEYSVMLNNSAFSLLPDDLPGWLLQPLFRIFAFIEKMFD